MNFKYWLLNEDMRDLAKAYSDALKDVPENPTYHPEGTTLKHVKLVRRSINSAISELQALKSNPICSDILSNLDFNLTKDDVEVLNMAAWLHDIGKTTATTIGGIPFRNAAGGDGKIQAISHEKPEHYGPQIEKLLALSPNATKNFYDLNRDLINFLIERHMDFSHGGFPSKIISTYFENGIIKNERPIKLLLVLMWADKMGRAKSPDLAKNIEQLQIAAEKSRRSSKKSMPFKGSEADFRDMLRSRGLSDAEVDAAARAKFGTVQD